MNLIIEIWFLALTIGLVVSLTFTILGWVRDARQEKEVDERFQKTCAWIDERLKKGKRV